jgi:hypothetical protein
VVGVGLELADCPSGNNGFSVESGGRGKLILIDSGGTFGDGLGDQLFTSHAGTTGFLDDNWILSINGFGDVDGTEVIGVSGRGMLLGGNYGVGAVVGNLPDSPAATVEDYLVIAGANFTDGTSDLGTERVLRMDGANDNDNRRTAAFINSNYTSTRTTASALLLGQITTATNAVTRLITHDARISNLNKFGAQLTVNAGSTSSARYEGSCTYLNTLRVLGNDTADGIQTEPSTHFYGCKNCLFFNGTGSFRWNGVTINGYDSFVDAIVTSLGFKPWPMLDTERTEAINAARPEPRCQTPFQLRTPFTVPGWLLDVEDQTYFLLDEPSLIGL